MTDELADEIARLRGEVERLTEALALGVKAQGELVLLVQKLTKELGKQRRTRALK